MVTIIGVRFRVAGKIYYFDPGALQIGQKRESYCRDGSRAGDGYGYGTE